MKVGVISDTHGYIHPEVFSIFDGVELILHAGDIGSEDIITSLETLAPVQAVHGNIDLFPLSTRYPEVFVTTISGVAICMIHQLVDIRTSKIQEAVKGLSKSAPDVLIYGHSHQAKTEWRDNVLFFNPGSAGKRRFSLPPAVGLLEIDTDGKFEPKTVYLEDE